MRDREKNCPMRHKNGNCLPAGGFCTAVNKSICEALHNAYKTGKQHVLNDISAFISKKEWHRGEQR